MAYKQITPALLGTEDGLGWCLRFTQSAFGAPVAHPSARSAWDHQQGRHVGESPPKGVAVPIWLDHWGTYSKKYANWGHVAVSLPDGRVFTSPLLGSQLNRWDSVKGELVGSAIYPSIAAMQKDIGGSPKYLGWSEYMNGKKIVTEVTNTKPNSGQKEDEDMPKNSGVYWKVKGTPNTYSYANFNLGSGFFAKFGMGNGGGKMPGTYNNPLAVALDTPTWAEVTESHARVLEAACAAVRAGK